MKLRISGSLAVAAFALVGIFGIGQSLAQNAYIPNQGSGTVTVIDTATNTVTATIPIGTVTSDAPLGSQPVGVAVTRTAARSISRTPETTPCR